MLLLGQVHTNYSYGLIHIIKLGKRKGFELMNEEHSLSLVENEVSFYDPTYLQRMENAFSALLCGDFLSELDFPIGSVGELWDFVYDHTRGGVSTSGGGNQGV